MESDIDLVLLDLALPRLDGVEVCRRLRMARPALPILILTARGSEEERVKGLSAGADDYLTKPFGTNELLARIDALRRRASIAPADAERVEIDGCLLDLGRCEAHRNGAAIALTPREVGILRWLHRHRTRAVSRAELLQTVWGAQRRDRDAHGRHDHRQPSPEDRARARRAAHRRHGEGRGLRMGADVKMRVPLAALVLLLGVGGLLAAWYVSSRRALDAEVRLQSQMATRRDARERARRRRPARASVWKSCARASRSGRTFTTRTSTTIRKARRRGSPSRRRRSQAGRDIRSSPRIFRSTRRAASRCRR